MKLNLGYNAKERLLSRHIKEGEWHLYFAWLPVGLGDKDWRWLEVVWRKRNNYRFEWEYKKNE